ncbi:MAG: squalene--hopene cyclase [Planctomycetes bacterium]|nr:squalene--hopene cyclase [Planctomycetota bacterium]
MPHDAVTIYDLPFMLPATGPDRQTLEMLARTAGDALVALKSLQRTDGHWCAELEGDSILQSEYLLMKWILGQERSAMADGRDGADTLQKIVRYLRSQQRADGGWGQYPGSAIDLSATVKAYFCLKLHGDSPDAPHMSRARAVTRSMGGAEKCNSFSNFYLAALGQISWNAVPAIPPEIVWLPKWFYFHMDRMSAWSRTMILPLAIVATLQPTRKLGSEQGIAELFLSEHDRHRLKMPMTTPHFWRVFFKVVDSVLKFAGRVIGTAPRMSAIRAAYSWILARASQDAPAPTQGLGAIFPPMVYIQVVFHALGVKRSDPLVLRAEKDLDAFFIEERAAFSGAPASAPASLETIHIQPCFSPVWDTGIAGYALADCGLTASSDRSFDRATAWLRAKEVRWTGDWIANVRPGTRAAGWYFEYQNAWYPDVDDTVMVAMTLKRAGGAENEAAARRGVEWVFAMQCENGGWAAFDRTRNHQIYEYVPFADHNAMQDPACHDITGRTLECMSWLGYRIDNPTIAHAVEFIKGRQEPEGCFWGRWGVNYIYGTWQAVIGPIRCGVPRSEPWIQRAGAWIKSVQKPDGSFGETANSYEDRSLMGTGPSTASQTAWAAMVLQEVYGANDPDLWRALRWLAQTQLRAADAAQPTLNPDGDPAGSWVETEFTGTGFPKVFYLRYHLYRLYFPLMAIGRALSAHGISVQEPGQSHAPNKIKTALAQ